MRREFKNKFRDVTSQVNTLSDEMGDANVRMDDIDDDVQHLSTNVEDYEGRSRRRELKAKEKISELHERIDEVDTTLTELGEDMETKIDEATNEAVGREFQDKAKPLLEDVVEESTFMKDFDKLRDDVNQNTSDIQEARMLADDVDNRVTVLEHDNDDAEEKRTKLIDNQAFLGQFGFSKG